MIAEHLKNDLPVKYHETFDVLDSSKIQCFMDCPRKFFFRYCLGWQSDSPNVHLVFGGAWHEAMEYLLNNGYSEVNVYEAYIKFQEYWDDKYPTNWLGESHSSKNKENALKALKSYAKEWRSVDNFETLYTEISGSVPIDRETLLYVKLDSINHYPSGAIKSMEHKTTGRKSNAWMNKWHSKFQVGTYSHFLNVLFPDNSEGIVINGSIIRASGNNEFIRIPIDLQARQMEYWLWEAKHWVDQIRWNFQELARCKEEDPVLTAFPRNTESCGKFGCPHPHLCNNMSNPLQRQDEPPIGFKEEWWDPRKRHEEAKTVVELEKSKEIKVKDTDKESKDKTHHSNE